MKSFGSSILRMRLIRDGTVEVPERGGLKPSNREMRKEVYVSYVNIGLSNGIQKLVKIIRHEHNECQLYMQKNCLIWSVSSIKTR